MMLATLLLASSASALSATSWQKRLDRAVLDVDLSVEQRVRNLQRVVQATPEVLSDVRSAVDAVRVKGFAEGHVEFLDTLFPVGTTARSDLEGLQALRKQVPEVRAALRTQAAPSAPPAVDSAEATKAAKQIAREVAGLRDTKKRKALEEEIKNAFRSTPKGLETPTYAVEETLGAVELRAYEPYAVAALKEAKADGAGFNTLAAFLFGKNDEDKAMDMTMPVEMTDGKMAFVLPKADEAAPPTPDDAEVVIERRAARLVAAVAFAGIATPEEVERQRARLAAALAETDAVAADGDEYTVLQYNAPYTIPWRRRNELVVPVTRAAAGPPTAAAWRAACDASGVVSYADFGIRVGAVEEVAPAPRVVVAAGEPMMKRLGVYEADEDALLAASTFPLAPDALIARCKEVLGPDIGVGTKDGGACLAEDFEFCAAVVGPIGKEAYLEALGTFQLEDAFPDLDPKYHLFRVDPFDEGRVWFHSRSSATHTEPLMGKPATGKKLELPPQCFHIDFTAEGLVKEIGFYVIDRRVGNTGGLGGAFAFFYGTGNPLPIPECQPYKPSKRFRLLNFVGKLGAKFAKKE